MDNPTPTIETYIEQIADAFAGVAKALVPAIQAFSTLCASLYAAMYEQYKAAGMPYGEGHEGLMRWMDDQAQIRHHLSEIERIEIRHETLIHARQLGARIQAKLEMEEK